MVLLNPVVNDGAAPGVLPPLPPEDGEPMIILVPFRAETGMFPQMVVPDIDMLVALAHELPVQYCMIEPETTIGLVMQTFVVPSDIPCTRTSKYFGFDNIPTLTPAEGELSLDVIILTDMPLVAEEPLIVTFVPVVPVWSADASPLVMVVLVVP